MINTTAPDGAKKYGVWINSVIWFRNYDKSRSKFANTRGLSLKSVGESQLEKECHESACHGQKPARTEEQLYFKTQRYCAIMRRETQL